MNTKIWNNIICLASLIDLELLADEYVDLFEILGTHTHTPLCKVKLWCHGFWMIDFEPCFLYNQYWSLAISKAIARLALFLSIPPGPIHCFCHVHILQKWRVCRWQLVPSLSRPASKLWGIYTRASNVAQYLFAPKNFHKFTIFFMFVVSMVTDASRWYCTKVGDKLWWHQMWLN